jgi:hypothetical protein
MSRKPLIALAACMLGGVVSHSAIAADPLGSSHTPQSLTLDQVREAEAQQRARGEFANAKYTTTHISAGNFVNHGDGSAPSYLFYEYRYRPTTVTNPNYSAQVSLPQGAKVCYLGIDYYDNDTGNNIEATFSRQFGFDDTNVPTGEYLDVATSSDAPTSHYGHASAMLAPYCAFSLPPPISACVMYLPACYTINNDIHNNGGGGLGSQYTVVVYIPTSAAASNLQFRGVDLRWYRQIAAAPVTATFSDVTTLHWAYQYVEALKASGITTGATATTFNPNGTVSRAEMAVFLSRALGLYWPD